jgi:pyruvate/2-oxoglutarate dehydrogenase complex dihydrolipoamide acyltransferase (E2) component
MAEGRPLRGWRKIANATWGAPTNPQIFGDLEIDATAALAFITAAREAGSRITLTHLVGRAIAQAFAEHPDLNGRVYGGRFVRRETVDVFFIVSAERGSELSGVKVRRADAMSVFEVADELRARTQRIHAGTDAEFGRTKQMLQRVPTRVLSWMLRLSAWLAVDRDLDLPRLGVERQTFGSAMVSSVGMFGIQHAYAPLAPYYRVPLLVLVGEVQRRPVAVGGDEVEVRPMVNLAATIDHRYLDGFHAARMARSVTAYLSDPGRFEPAPGG